MGVNRLYCAVRIVATVSAREAICFMILVVPDWLTCRNGQYVASACRELLLHNGDGAVLHLHNAMGTPCANHAMFPHFLESNWRRVRLCSSKLLEHWIPR